jgi:hypothetical protein
MNYQPLIIIGAPRSGTNMLRDILCEQPRVGTWPCDEINYIWRHGNVSQQTDEFCARMATPKVKKFIRTQFDDFAKKEKLDVLVEKTCANSLRVPFVEKIVPEAKYIFIVRDGVDAVGSAMLRWTAELDIPYILKKVRYVPISDLPYYGCRYLGSRLFKLVSRQKRLSFWGPQFKGLDVALRDYSLEEVCALQWQRCVDLSEKSFSKIPEDKFIRVRYEDFVANPAKELTQVLAKLNMPFDIDSIEASVRAVTARSLGKGRKALNQKQLESISSLVANTLQRYDYEC